LRESKTTVLLYARGTDHSPAVLFFADEPSGKSGYSQNAKGHFTSCFSHFERTWQAFVIVTHNEKLAAWR